MTSSNEPRPLIAVRPLEADDLGAALALNNANLPAVNELDAEQIAALRGIAVARFAAVDGNGTLLGFCLVYGPGEDYASLNYQWFARRFTDSRTAFAYLDRIVVDDTARGRGIGKALYAAVFDHLGGFAPLLCCEVNIRPMNERSLRFHASLGFTEVGRQLTDGGNKEVSLMTCSIPPRDGRGELSISAGRG